MVEYNYPPEVYKVEDFTSPPTASDLNTRYSQGFEFINLTYDEKQKKYKGYFRIIKAS